MTVAGSLAIPLLADHSVGDDAALVSSQLTSAQDYTPTMSLGEPRREALLALDRAYQQARREDWDGEGALPVPLGAYRNALSVLRALPTALPLPDIFADSDGDISMEWFSNPSKVFAVAVSWDGTLHYAGLFGESVSKGKESLVESLPPSILDGIRRAVEP
jgi:hypothetical protein